MNVKMFKTYTILGDPTPWKRAGLKKSGMYDTQKTLKLMHGITVASQHGDDRKFKGPLQLDVTFYIYTKDRSRWGKYHNMVPDIDNLIKYIADMCTSVLYDDDKLIAYSTVKKVWWHEPKTVFSLRELPITRCKEIG